MFAVSDLTIYFTIHVHICICIYTQFFFGGDPFPTSLLHYTCMICLLLPVRAVLQCPRWLLWDAGSPASIAEDRCVAMVCPRVPWLRVSCSYPTQPSFCYTCCPLQSGFAMGVVAPRRFTFLPPLLPLWSYGPSTLRPWLPRQWCGGMVSRSSSVVSPAISCGASHSGIC